jgi:toxin-antitoxin system PIN domain toxin
MRSLLDVNVFIALLDKKHAEHQRVGLWFAEHGSAGWASCPLTQNGTICIISNNKYPNTQPLAEVRRKVNTMCKNPAHAFWSDDVSFLDDASFDHGVVLKGEHITDAYLLALAVKNNGRFVTLDHNFPTNAVKGYRPENLLRL